MADGNIPGPDWLYNFMRSTNPFLMGGGGSADARYSDPVVGQLESMAQATFAPQTVANIENVAQQLRDAGYNDSQVAQTIAQQMGIGVGGSAGSALAGMFGGDATTQTVGDTTDPLAGLADYLNGGGKYVGLSDIQGLGLTGNDAYNALLAQFGLDPESRAISAANSAAAQTNASANYMNALTNAAQQKATEAYQQGQLLVQQGQLDLAEKQFAASEYWTGVANDLSQRQFQLEAAATPANIATQMYGAQESALQGRGALQLGSANTYSGLATLLGDLATTQANMGINLLTNPRNAVAAFLLGQGADPANAAKFGQFNVQRLLGIDPAQIQAMIQNASQAAAQAQATSTQPQQIDLQTFLNNLQSAAAAAAQPGNTGTNPNASTGGGGGGGGGGTGPVETPPQTTPPTTPNYTRPVSGTVTIQPSNPVVRQSSPAPTEPDRGPFVQTYIQENPAAIARALYGEDLLNKGVTVDQANTLTADAGLTLRRLLRN